MVFGAIRPPGGPLRSDAAESDDGGAEVLAESLIFAMPNDAFFGAKLSTIRRSKSQPKKPAWAFGVWRIHFWATGTAPGCNDGWDLWDLWELCGKGLRSPNAFFPLGTAAKEWQKYPPRLDHERFNRF
jgi:hypothetical protein